MLFIVSGKGFSPVTNSQETFNTRQIIIVRDIQWRCIVSGRKTYELVKMEKAKKSGCIVRRMHTRHINTE